MEISMIYNFWGGVKNILYSLDMVNLRCFLVPACCRSRHRQRFWAHLKSTSSQLWIYCFFLSCCFKLDNDFQFDRAILVKDMIFTSTPKDWILDVLYLSFLISNCVFSIYLVNISASQLWVVPTKSNTLQNKTVDSRHDKKNKFNNFKCFCCLGVFVFQSITGWWFQICFIFTPILGEIIQFDEHIFQMGWFNHQLDKGHGNKV